MIIQNDAFHYVLLIFLNYFTTPQEIVPNNSRVFNRRGETLSFHIQRRRKLLEKRNK